MRRRWVVYCIAALVWVASLCLHPSNDWLFGSGIIALMVLTVVELLLLSNYASAWYPDTRPWSGTGQWRLLALAFSTEGADDPDFVARKHAIRALTLIYLGVLVSTVLLWLVRPA